MLQLENDGQRSLTQVHEASAHTDSETPVVTTGAPNTSSVHHQRTASRKSRITLACKRCKRRKQRVSCHEQRLKRAVERTSC